MKKFQHKAGDNSNLYSQMLLYTNLRSREPLTGSGRYEQNLDIFLFLKSISDQCNSGGNEVVKANL